MPVNTRIQFRRGTAGAGATQWTDQVLYAGEVGFETDTGKFKIGDGTTAWNSLGYASVLPSELNELVDDRVNGLLVAGTGIALSYNDSGNSLTVNTNLTAGSGISISGATISLSDPTIQAADITDFNSAVSGLLPVTNVSAGSGISVSSSSGNYTISLSDPTIQVGDITDFVDGVNDRVGSLLTAGSNIQLTYTDNGNATSSLQIAVTGISMSGHTHTSTDITDFAEAVDDRVGSLLVAGSGVSLSYNDGSNTLTITSSLVAGSGISVAESSGVYTVSLSDPTIQVADITDLTASASELNLLDGSVANTVVNSKAVIYGSAGEIAASSIATSGNVTVGGDLVVNGTTVTVNSTVTTLDDPILTLGGDTAPSSNDSKDRGIEFRWHNGSAAKLGFFGYDNSTGKFTFIPDATNSSEAFSGTVGELDAKIDWSNVNNKPDPVIAVDITGDVVGSGNLTMTDLAGGTISISTTVQANSVALGTDTTGDYVASVAVSGTGLSVSGSGEGASVVVTSNATNANTASTIVARDGSGNFSAGTITADLTGTASNANNIEVDASSSNVNHLVFVNGTDGNLKPSVNSNLRFDAANNELLGDDNTTPTTKLKYFVIDGGTP